jgi:hypothetical protein
MTVRTKIERLIERWIDKRIGNGIKDQQACVGSRVREVESQKSQRVSRQRAKHDNNEDTSGPYMKAIIT